MAKKRARKRKAVFKWAPYPVSKATNSYELCQEVIDAIIAEPKRYDQGTFGSGPRVRGEKPDPNHLDLVPACGTVACYAGWMVLLRVGSINRLLHESVDMIATCMMPESVRDELDTLFGGTAQLEDLMTKTERERHWDSLPPIGSPDYARLGVRRMRQFMKDNRAALKAHKLEKVRKR